jgi:thymidylate synthase (FAD)
MNEDKIVKTFDYGSFRVNVVRPPFGNAELRSHSTNSDDVITMLSKGYEGEYSSREYSTEEINLAFADANRTRLTTPAEFIHTAWLITGVTRAFTHQLVRTRHASYVQESMRFLGHKKTYEVLVIGSILDNTHKLQKYADAISVSIDAYESLLALGASSEDARGVLPTNIITSIFMDISISSLKKMYADRMCCQAQPGEWQSLLKQMKEIVRTQISPNVASLLSAPYERGEPCGYRASYDRPCIWQKEAPIDDKNCGSGANSCKC